MALVALKLLGGFQCTIGDQPTIGFATDKVRALLSYLAVETARPHTRVALAALLWPNLAQGLANNNLRKSLTRLRQTLDQAAPGASSVLVITRTTIQFVAQEAAVDLLTMQKLLAECQSHDHLELRDCDICLARMAQAINFYQGELLAGLSLADAPAFEEWLLHWRETLHQQITIALSALSEAHEWRGELQRAMTLTNQLVALDPYREATHRQKMRLLAKLGLPNQALEQFETFSRLLKQELGTEVEDATSALAQQIRNRAYADKDPVASIITQSPPTHFRPPTPPILEDVPASGRVYGRHHEVAQLTQWLTHEQTRLITIVGMGGIGKTTLAAAATRAVANRFDLVLWRSMINAPPIEEILLDWLATLSEDRLAPLPRTLDGQLASLLDHLRNRRCLLVLDNLESIFQPNQAGQIRTEHRAYAQLLQRIATTHHQSSLLLTSRELPQGLARLEEDLPWVRSIALDGLDIVSAQALLSDRGLTGEHRTTVSLVERYSGNPLALKLVAETAQGLFAGDIAAFLGADTLIFDDILAVLDWQFNRLPALEQEILFWFAIEREPISIKTLHENLSPPRPLPDVVVAVRDLQRRSLLERIDTSELSHRHPPESAQTVSMFALQNVLMEYLIDRLVEAAHQELEQEELVRLHRHPLIKAQAKEYVRQSQVRLILQRVANRLLTSFPKEEIGHKMARILTTLRGHSPLTGGYAAGSLLNLLLMLEIDLTGYDFSHLHVWQADLRRAHLPNVNFTGADLAHTVFVDCFGFIFDAVYSPDGKWVATATDRGEVRVWQAADGRLVRNFAGHLGPVRSVAFSPNGMLLASGGEDNTIRIWNLSEPQTHAGFHSPHILRGHSGRVISVAFHPDGKRVASASVDKSVRLWDLATGETTAILQGHEGWVWSLAFHPEGELLASAGFDSTIRLWDVERATTRAILHGHSGTVSTLVFDPQGKSLASGSFDRTVRLWDVQSGTTIQQLEASMDALWRVAFSPDGRWLATAGDDQVARIWDLQNGTILHVFHGHKDVIFAVAFSPDGKTLLTGAADQSIHLWDIPTLRIRQIIAGPNQTVPTIAYHPNGKLLLSAYYNGIVRVWDLERKTSRQTLADPERVLSTIAISHDGASLAVGGDELELWGIDQAERIQRRFLLRRHRGRVFTLVFSPDSSLLASGGLDEAVYVWDVKSGQMRHTLPGNDAPVYSSAFSPDGSLLATGSVDHYIRLWNPHTAELLHQWQTHRYAVWAIAFTPDGQTLISSGGDGMISLWDIRIPTQPILRATLRGHTERVFSLVISTDGRRLYSGGADRTIMVWDLQSNQPVQTLHGNTHWVWSLSLSPDNKTVASGSPDETIRLWDTQSGESLVTLVAPGPYAGMNIHNARGITEAEKVTLKLLGATEG